MNYVYVVVEIIAANLCSANGHLGDDSCESCVAEAEVVTAIIRPAIRLQMAIDISEAIKNIPVQSSNMFVLKALELARDTCAATARSAGDQ